MPDAIKIHRIYCAYCSTLYTHRTAIRSHVHVIVNLIQHFPIEQRSEREHELLPDSFFNSKHDSGDSISVPNSFCLFVRCCHSTVQF